jgi:glycosyltransferase involved in cell wall biosynthesis
MNIWILQTGEPLHIDTGNPRPMRAMNLANALISAGHNVVLWSSAFYHQEKRHRCHVAKTIHVSPQLEIRLIPSPGYQRNIGLGRLWDHAILAINLKKQLQQEKTQPDVAFIGYPPIEAAAVMTRWLTLRGIPSLLDVKDQWPSIFVEALPRSLQPIGRIAFAPYFYLAKRAMRDATGISAMADGFLQWAITFAKKSCTAMDKVIPLTTASDQISDIEIEAARQWWDDQGIVKNGKPRIIFVGSHSQAFDFKTVVEAAKTLAIANNNCEFVICGTGEYFVTNKEITKEITNIFFPGWISRTQLIALTERSIASIAPYNNTKDFIMSIPNKIIDSLSLGLPIITPLRGEVANLISEYDIGLQYTQNSSTSLVECIEKIINNSALQQEMANNALKLYQEVFSYDIVYGSLVKHLEMLSHQKRNNA